MDNLHFKDFLLRDELVKAIHDVQFEHPSEVQQLTIPKATMGVDILCQAKSGTGKTAVFVLSSLQQITFIPKETLVLVIAHTKELVKQIEFEFKRFAMQMPHVTIKSFTGGKDIKADIIALEESMPTVFVGTLGRTLDLVKRKVASFRHLKHFIVDEADEIVSDLKNRFVLQKILYKTPKEKQTMFFTATLSVEVKKDCLKFLRSPHIVCVDEKRLTLHGLDQSYKIITEEEKLDYLTSLLDNIEFSQLVIFCGDKQRVDALSRVIREKGFPSLVIHSGMDTTTREDNFKRFRDGKERVLVTTNLMARGIDVADVNVVINFDMSDSADTYLHRVGRAGRFETKGMAISFIESAEDKAVLEDIQSRFEVNIKSLDGNE